MPMEISRRTLLAAAAGAVPALGMAASAPVKRRFDVEDASDSWWDRFDGPRITATEAGASRESPDNQPVLQKALDWLSAQPRPGRLVIPEGVWQLRQPLLQRSNVLIEGVGRQSVLSSSAKSRDLRDSTTLLVGAMQASGRSRRPNGGILSLASVAIQAGRAGDLMVTLKSPSDASQLKPQDIIFLWSDEGPPSTTWRYYQQMNRVTSVSGARVGLSYPLYKDLAGADPRFGVAGSANLDGLGSHGEMAYVADSCGVRNLGLSSEYGRAFHMSGVFESRFQDLEMIRSTHLFGGNAISYCRGDRISGLVTEGAVNTAYFSHNRILTDLKSKWDGRPPTRRVAAILLEENCHDTITRNVDFDAGDCDSIVSVVRIAKAAENNLVEDVNFRSTGRVRGYGVEINYTEAGPRGGNIVRRVTADRPGATGIAVVASQGAHRGGRKSKPDIIEDVEILMPDSPLPAVVLKSGDVEIRRLKTIDGRLQVDGAMPGVVVDDWTADRDIEVNDVTRSARVRNARRRVGGPRR